MHSKWKFLLPISVKKEQKKDLYCGGDLAYVKINLSIRKKERLETDGNGNLLFLLFIFKGGR